jgi:competence protein ComEC
VGQGDSELIEDDNHFMLIDTGTTASQTALMNYLKSQNIKKIDYLVLTHPHEDHIGGATDVINTYSIGKIYMPKVTTTTKTYENVINAISAKGLNVSQPALETTFSVGSASNGINANFISRVNTLLLELKNENSSLYRDFESTITSRFDLFKSVRYKN